MNLEEVVNRIFHVNYPSQLTLASTFLRFQEHYESPEFRNKIFSLKEYKKWYIANTGKGRFTYYRDWVGFNIPSCVMEPFYEGRFDPLSRKEVRLMEAFEGMRERKFYVVGTFGDTDMRTLNHEIAHGLFYTNKKYRGEVMKVVGSLPNIAREWMAKYLRGLGYHEAVFDDETHAFILSDMEELDRRIGKRIIRNASAELRPIFDRYYKR